ncbi:hypothetical protein RDWZM_005020 [Blomia tropicalis]|uniref:CTCHY-type domain-containing protein n=1 Tax=Blomia tropicalis TaxID=40697 RepID=A0A9Q0M5W9_BLOTA|nr:hypothetical protein RDWZM_005020 [Blomia tropicalis]
MMSIVIQEIEPPMCKHGPARRFSGGEIQEFNEKTNRKRKAVSSKKPNEPYFACSAYRDIRLCSFRMEENRWIMMSDSARAELNKKKWPVITPENEYAYLFDDYDYTNAKTYAFCYDCRRVLVNPLVNPTANVPTYHRFDYHLTTRCGEIVSNLPRSYFNYPCKLLEAATTNEGQAQFFFDESVTGFIIEELIKSSGYTKVLCIGCPSIHEEIVTNHSQSLSSFLLDIDIRFQQFFPSSQFAQFNMFNYFFFGDTTAEVRLQQFLLGEHKLPSPVISDIILIIDPPFGGRMDFLAEVIRKIQTLITGIVEISDESTFPAMLLFFPYFNEHWITRSFNGVKITDFIVNYLNHNKFKRKSANESTTATTLNYRKISSSIVRMFTNLDRSKIDLSKLNSIMQTENGDPFYRWCERCARYVFHSNQHCIECNQCPARDATKPYGHCDHCGICVKSSWKHCDQCKRCHLASSCNN